MFQIRSKIWFNSYESTFYVTSSFTASCQISFLPLLCRLTQHHDTTHNNTCTTAPNRAYTVTPPHHRRSVFPLPLFPESRCLGRSVGICLSASPLRAILPRLKVALSDNLIALFCCNASLRPLPVAVLRARPRDMDLRRTNRIWSNCWNQSDVLNQVQMLHHHHAPSQAQCGRLLLLLQSPNTVVQP